MWERALGYIPPFAVLLSALLSAIIPWSIYVINKKLHKYGDPPWKNSEQDDDNEIEESTKTVIAIIILFIPLIFMSFIAGKS
jgi:hypothetical protein